MTSAYHLYTNTARFDGILLSIKFSSIFFLVEKLKAIMKWEK